MRSQVGFAMLFLLTFASASYSQKMEFMQDMPEGDQKITARQIMVVIKDEAVSSVTVTDRDGDSSFVESVSSSNRNVRIEIPVGKTFIISTFQTGTKAAREKRLISVQENGQVKFGLIQVPNADSNTVSSGTVSSSTANPVATGAKPTPQISGTKPSVKVKLEAHTILPNDSVVKIPTKLEPAPTMAGSYVVAVTNAGITETEEVPFEIKNAAIVTEKELVVSLKKGDSTVSIYPRIGDLHIREPASEIKITCPTCTRQTSVGKEPYKLSRNLQVYFGTEIVGASSASSQAQPFLNVKLFLPIRFRNSCANFEWNRGCLAFWTDFRFASSASQALPNFASISGPTASSFFANNQSANLNQLVRSFQTKIGLEYGIGRNTSFIIGGGITSPLSAIQSVQAYRIPRTGPNNTGPVTPAFEAVFGSIDNSINTLILKSGERDRFQRNWFLGGRVRYDIFGDEYVAPAELDLTFGQDEAITRKLSGFVMKFDATIPIKIADKQVLYFGAGYNLRLTRNVNTIRVPFFLEPTANYNLFDNTNLVRDFDDTPFGTSTRDTYSFRVGVDILRLIFGNKGDESKATSEATSDNLTRQKGISAPLAQPLKTKDK